MNPTAIYSKSGKGVQEAAGKTSLLARPDRAVLSAIDGRATLADVAKKVGKAFDASFQQVIRKLDSDGFIREVSAGTAAPAPRPAAKAPAKPVVPDDPASDLDFSMLGSKPPSAPSRPAAPPPKPAAAPPKPAAPPPPPPPPPPKEQESALFRARQEAEAKAAAERERQRKEAEEKVRAEAEARLRAEAEAKARAEAEAKFAAETEAKLKAAREAAVKAAAEAKAKAEEEARRAREEAERARREAEERERRAREEAERVRREAEERERKAREEAERLRREAEERERKAREEAERRAREEAERKAREEAERIRREAEEKARREAEELRQRLEEERRAREEAERKAREEAERAKRELEEERRRLEEERRTREAEEAQEAEEREARRRAREEEEARAAAEQQQKKKAKKAEPPPEEKSGAGFSDSLMADLEAFTTREEEEARAREEAERKAREERERKAREEAERKAREEAEARAKEEKRRAKEEKERKKREEEERLRREEEERQARIREEEERRKREAEERERKAKEEAARERQAVSSVAYVPEEKRRMRALEVGPRDPSLARRRQRRWGRPVAIALFVLLAIGIAVLHFIPISTVDYERAATEALGRPVRIGSARLWLLTGLELRMRNVTAGDVKVARVIARPTLGSLAEPRKLFSAIELEGVSIPQEQAGAVLFAQAKSDSFGVERLVARKLQLPGPLTLPGELEAEISYHANGAVRLVNLRGDQGFVARIEPRGETYSFSASAASFTVPFAPEISFLQFGMKGTGNAHGAQIQEWDGQALNGTFSGTARVRWGATWAVDGVITARGVNAAVFAPALLSEGQGEGTAKFAMTGTDPGKLGQAARFDGRFTVSKGVLGSFDLSRAIQTGGKYAQGRTQFTEMSGQVSYDRGEVELRNVTIGAGALNAGASALITPKGALSGRIVADVRTASQSLSATLNLGGTVKEPQVRN